MELCLQTDEYHSLLQGKTISDSPVASNVLHQYVNQPCTRHHVQWSGPFKVLGFKVFDCSYKEDIHTALIESSN